MTPKVRATEDASSHEYCSMRQQGRIRGKKVIVSRENDPHGTRRDTGKLTSSSPPQGHQPRCCSKGLHGVCAHTARTRRAVSSIVAIVEASVRLERAAIRPSRRRGSAEVCRGQGKTQLEAHRVS